MEQFYVTLTANTGLLLQYGDTKILLDSIYGTQGHRFSNLPQHIWEKIQQGMPPFDHISYLLFSHDHPDHFCANRTNIYLQKQQVKGLMLSNFVSMTDENKALFAQIQKQNIPCVLLQKENVKQIRYALQKDIQCKAYAMRHQGKIYENVPHFCFLLTVAGKRFLFTADVDFVEEDFSVFADMDLSAMFVNPLFLHSKEGQFILTDICKPKQVVVYHIPFLSDDVLHMRRMVQRHIQDTNVLALTEAMETILWHEEKQCFLKST